MTQTKGKRGALLCFALLFSVLLAALTGCAADEVPGTHRVAADIGSENSSADLMVCEIDGHEDRITELSELILMVRDVRNDYDKAFNDGGCIRFTYTGIIEEIYMDRTGKFKEGDEVSFLSYHGYCPLSKAKELLGDYWYESMHFTDGDEIVTYLYGALPIEEGGTYILYVNARQDGGYGEMGRNYLYQCVGDSVYEGCERTKSKYSLKELKKHIRTLVENRTGIAEEIGDREYLMQCGEEDFKRWSEYLKPET